jgi:hypothetical protein
MIKKNKKVGRLADKNSTPRAVSTTWHGIANTAASNTNNAKPKVLKDSCCVCGEEFFKHKKKNCSVKETRSDRKIRYHFCSRKCRKTFDKGFIR